MTYLLLVGSSILNLLCVGMKKKSKIVTFISILVFSLIFGGNNYNADYNAYFLNYRLIATGYSYFDFDPFFNILMKIGATLHLEYNVFLTIICLVMYALMFGILFRNNNYKIHSIILLYTIYSFFIDAIQISNFISNVFAIIFVFIMFEYKKNPEKKLLLLSSISLILAIGFHTSAVALVPFYFFVKSNKTNVFAIGAVALACFDTLLKHSFVNILFNRIPYLRAYSGLSYYGEKINSGWGFLIYLVIILLMIGLVKYSKYEKECNEVVNFLQYVLVLTPVMVISTISYTRFFRVMMVAYSCFYNKINARRSKRDFYIGIVIIAMFVYLFAREIGMANFGDVMNNNYFFN